MKSNRSISRYKQEEEALFDMMQEDSFGVDKKVTSVGPGKSQKEHTSYQENDIQESIQTHTTPTAQHIHEVLSVELPEVTPPTSGVKIIAIDESTQALILQNLQSSQKSKADKQQRKKEKTEKYSSTHELSQEIIEYMKDKVLPLIAKQTLSQDVHLRRNVEVWSLLQHLLANIIAQQLMQPEGYKYIRGIKSLFTEYVLSSGKHMSNERKEHFFSYKAAVKFFVGAMSHALVNRYFQRAEERRFFMYPLTVAQIGYHDTRNSTDIIVMDTDIFTQTSGARLPIYLVDVKTEEYGRRDIWFKNITHSPEKKHQEYVKAIKTHVGRNMSDYISKNPNKVAEVEELLIKAGIQSNQSNMDTHYDIYKVILSTGAGLSEYLNPDRTHNSLHRFHSEFEQQTITLLRDAVVENHKNTLIENVPEDTPKETSLPNEEESKEEVTTV